MIFLGALSLVVLALGVGLLLSGSLDFAPYLGTDHPVLVLIVVVALGGVSLLYLEKDGQFSLWQPDRCLKGAATAFGLATVFAPVAIVMDLVVRFPQDLNVLPPAGFLFYPTVGYVAEVVFHLVPITLILLLFRRIRSVAPSRVLLLGVTLAALMEPGFQVAAGLQDGMSLLSSIGMFTYLLGFSATQLWVFKRFGFATMYLQRLIYYGYWHILWGTARLEWLF